MQNNHIKENKKMRGRLRPMTEPSRRDNQTDLQRTREQLVYAAWEAYEAAAKATSAGEVNDKALARLVILARKMVYLVGLPRVFPDDGDLFGCVVGVLLAQTKRPNGEPYRLVLETRPLEGQSGFARVLYDGGHPHPCDRIDGWRFAVAMGGLLREVERVIVELRDGDDWDWSDGSDGPADPEDLHPDAMLRRIREMRREVRRWLLVDHVHAL